MRTLLMLAVLIGAVLVGGWIGGETLIARTVREAIASDPRLEAARITQLREPDRIGVRVYAPVAETPRGRVAMDWLDLFIPPGRPTELHATAAPGARLEAEGRVLTLGATGAQAWAGFSPTHDLALSHARVVAHDLALDGQPVVAGFDVDARLAGFGADAPQATRAAYDLNGEARGVSLAALTQGAVTGEAAAAGAGRVWLDRVPLRAAEVAGAGGLTAPPGLVGLRLDGVTLSLDALSGRVFARLVADEAGLATGEVLVDTADPSGLVAKASELGLLPANAVPLATTLLTGLGTAAAPAAAVDEAPAADETPRPAEAARQPGGTSLFAPPPGEEVDQAAEAADPAALHPALIPQWPAPRRGETRLKVTLADGRAFLGPLPIGPAPRLRPPAR